MKLHVTIHLVLIVAWKDVGWGCLQVERVNCSRISGRRPSVDSCVDEEKMKGKEEEEMMRMEKKKEGELRRLCLPTLAAGGEQWQPAGIIHLCHSR